MNKSAQFTPGPWRKGIDNTIYQSKTNKRIADVYMHMIYRDSDAQAQANATLIAAAPVMYAAGQLSLDVLMRVATELERTGNEELRSIVRSAIIEQKTALAQAEGSNHA